MERVMIRSGFNVALYYCHCIVCNVDSCFGRVLIELDPHWSPATSSVFTTICQAARYDQLQFFTLGLVSPSTFQICKRNFSPWMKNVSRIALWWEMILEVMFTTAQFKYWGRVMYDSRQTTALGKDCDWVVMMSCLCIWILPSPTVCVFWPRVQYTIHRATTEGRGNINDIPQTKLWGFCDDVHRSRFT